MHITRLVLPSIYMALYGTHMRAHQITLDRICVVFVSTR
jgi:hypothetical protein